MSIQAALLGNSAQPLNGSLSSDVAYGGRSGAGSVTTTGVLASPIGGTAPFTYAWTYVSGDATLSATASTSANTQWTGSVTIGDDKESVWKCVITDNFGNHSPDLFVNVIIAETSFV
jgi:hypothetical protein